LKKCTDAISNSTVHLMQKSFIYLINFILEVTSIIFCSVLISHRETDSYMGCSEM